MWLDVLLLVGRPDGPCGSSPRRAAPGPFYKKKLQDRARKGKLVGYEGDTIYRLPLPDGSIPDNPEQSGASERHGQTIWPKVSTVPTILQTAGILEEHWPEIVNTACYLANRSPYSALKD